MTEDQLRALLITGVLLATSSGTGGFVGGRMTAPEPEVRVVRLPPRVVRLPAPAPVVVELPAAPSQPPAAPPAVVEPPVAPSPVEPKPIETKPAAKAESVKPPVKAAPKPRHVAPPKKPAAAMPQKALPTCAVIQREYDAMTWPERWAAYHRASPEEIALGKRCLGM